MLTDFRTPAAGAVCDRVGGAALLPAVLRPSFMIAVPSILRTTAARAAIVAAVAVLSFISCLHNPPLADDEFIFSTRLAHGAVENLGQIWREPYWGQVLHDVFRPVGLSVIVLEHRAFGYELPPYRIVSFVLHASVSLLAMIVVGMLAGPRIGWVTALIFAAHPIHAEAVAMVYGQLELLAALFALAAIGLYVLARRERMRPVLFALSIGSSFLAVCSKESAVMLPALILLVRAVFIAGGESAASRRSRFLQGLGWDAFFLLPQVAYLLLRYEATGQLVPKRGETFLADYSAPTRIKAMIVSVGEAVRLSLFPTGQTVYYGHLRDSILGLPYSEAAWAAAGLLVVGALWFLIGGRLTAFGAAWFLLTLAPVSNVVPVGVLVAERTLYFTVLGAAFLGAALYDRAAERGGQARLAAAAALPCVVALGVVAGNAVVRNWSSNERLWRSTVASHPRSILANVFLGNAILHRWELHGVEDPPASELREAEAAFARALALNPDLPQALAGAGYAALRGGDYRRAQRFLEAAAAASPGDPKIAAALEECRRRGRTGSGAE